MDVVDLGVGWQNAIAPRVIVSMRSGAASVPSGKSGSSGSMWVSTSTSSVPNSSRILRSSSWVMSCAAGERHAGIDLQIDAHGELLAEVMHSDMMNGEA